jgi:hypothetical protein
VIQSEFEDAKSAEAVRSFHNDFGFVVEASRTPLENSLRALKQFPKAFCRVHKKRDKLTCSPLTCLILLAISPNLCDRCDDRNPVQEKHHEHQCNRHREDAGDKRSPGEAQARGHQEGQAREKPNADRANKKSEVMKRAKGATLAEIVEATGWQKHTVRGIVSILASKTI